MAYPPPSRPPSSYSHAVSRSDELLSCAKTAVKIAQKTHPTADGWWSSLSPAHLHLHNDTTADNSAHDAVLDEGLALLRTMDSELQKLEALVRRRGHTNDPTEEITLSVNRLQQDTQELTHWIQTLIPATARGQCQRHWQILQQWFQLAAQEQGKRLKEVLQVRGTVLAEQARRRKRFAVAQNAAVTKPALDNPLFQQQPLHTKKKNSGAQQQQQQQSTALPPPPAAVPNNSSAPPAPHPNSAPTPPIAANSAHSYYNNNAATARPVSGNAYSAGSTNNAYGGSAYGGGSNSAYGGGGGSNSAYGGGGYGGGSSGTYGGGYGGGGYGGAYGVSGNKMGMRQRRPAAALQQDHQHQETDHMQAQLIQRQQERQTVQRVQEARQAERSLAELGTLFGKMSTLITQQSEVMDKIEDDVEAANVDVMAGQQEIATLYSIKKGNRALILKVFGLLIFFIIFMKIYQGKK